MTPQLLRWPTEDPRAVLVGRAIMSAARGQMTWVRLQDGPLAGSWHQALATTCVVEGELVQVRGSMAFPLRPA